ncbi:MAG: hypothetical protein M3Z03_05890, partial [Actinomycetota bacterium]|nr:hypothetical protein [Actinomycetota bacterium]
MATTQRPRSGQKKPSSSRTKKKAAPPPTITERTLAALGAALRGHVGDLGGLLAIAIGLVAGLGIYADAAGPVGRGLDTAIGTAVGWGRFVAPVLLAAIGVLLVRGPRADENGEVLPPRAHLWVGGLLLTVAVGGLLHLAGGRPG